MAIFQVTCINKRGGHYNPHERIQAIGGYGWKHTEDEAIRNIDHGIHSYTVTVGLRTVRVVVAFHNFHRYLKTENDGYSPDNLLSLPECR